MLVVYASKKEKPKKLEERTNIVLDLKHFLKTDDTYLDLCSEYSKDPSIIDAIAVVFADDLDVTAKTINAKVFLNTSLVDEKFEIMARYLLHELTHCFQHMENDGKSRKKKREDYLDRPEELEAFQFQVAFDADQRSDEKVNEYIDHLLSYHEIPKEDRKDKKIELMDKLE
jgi:hypothetical protein